MDRCSSGSAIKWRRRRVMVAQWCDEPRTRSRSGVRARRHVANSSTVGIESLINNRITP
jgi:hypothetical protein